ncbi:DUF547 domain-containing protein [Sinimarinibacterium sp. CAU 1509]|nr:DUF547 domain-containing protein [Sinimarinibacterium sp. CAU 1509]
MRTLMMTMALSASCAASAFDHAYSEYGELLSGHTHWVADGHASAVDYAGLKRDHSRLQHALATFSQVTQPEFEQWPRAQQEAFLINAYNGFTLDLILSKYPALESIRDLSSLFRSPWKLTFFKLLGETRSLDWIEHGVLRPRYQDPRVHFAVNCASIGCPALRPEPYIAVSLDDQLDDQLRRFLSDRTRNRYNAADNTLYLSQIFDWYGDDFARDGRTLPQWLSGHAAMLTDNKSDRNLVRAGTFRIEHLSYNWTLNDAHSSH